MDGTLIFAAHGPATRALRLHCLFGDDLAFAAPGGGLRWYRQLTQDASSWSDSHTGHLSFSYGAEVGPDDGFVVSFGNIPGAAMLAALALRGRCTPEVAERKWAPMVALMGRMPRLAEVPRVPSAVMALPRGCEFAAARRAVHPSHLVDRLLLRERANAAREFERILAGPPRLGHSLTA